jgi:hypothetical protein
MRKHPHVGAPLFLFVGAVDDLFGPDPAGYPAEPGLRPGARFDSPKPARARGGAPTLIRRGDAAVRDAPRNPSGEATIQASETCYMLKRTNFMTCGQAIEFLDDYLDARLNGARVMAVRDHLAACPDCSAAVEQERRLREALKNLPRAQPPPGFVDRVLRRAVERGRERRRTLWFTMAAGGAIAAGLALWVATRVLLPAGPAAPDGIPGVTIAFHETKTVKLVVNSEHELPDAVFTLELPGDIELAGYPRQRTLTWRADVHRGANLLALPVVARGLRGGRLVARIEHQGRSKVLVLNMTVQGPDLSRNPWRFACAVCAVGPAAAKAIS